MPTSSRVLTRHVVFASLGLWALGCATGAPPVVTDAGVPGFDAGEDAGRAVLDAGPSCSADDECSDGDACNGLEACASGICVPGTPVVCDDAVGCTADTFDPGTGACAVRADDTRCAAGLMCDRVDGCIAPRPCESDATCDDGVFCNGAERCDPAFGCRRGDLPNCDDGFACTVDVCDDAADACGSTPADAACDDRLVCNGAEVCAPTAPGADGQG